MKWFILFFQGEVTYNISSFQIRGHVRFQNECDCSKVKVEHTTVKRHNIQLFIPLVCIFQYFLLYLFPTCQSEKQTNKQTKHQVLRCRTVSFNFHCIWKRDSGKLIFLYMSGPWPSSLGMARAWVLLFFKNHNPNFRKENGKFAYCKSGKESSKYSP